MMQDFIEFRTALLKPVHVRPFAIAAVREIDGETCELFITTFDTPITVDGSIDKIMQMIKDASEPSFTATG